MIRPFDVWACDSQVFGQSLNGELSQVTQPFRDIAERLAALPQSERGAVWDTFVSQQTDRAEIDRLRSLIDPLGPAPDPEEESESWLPLRLGELPSVDLFPVEILPETVSRLVMEGAEAIGCPPDFLALAALAVCAGVIGRSVSLHLKDGYFAKSIVFGAIVGPPSDGKTPALSQVGTPIERIDDILQTAFDQELARREQEAEAAEDSKGKGQKSKPPPLPKLGRIAVDDITMETLPLILAENPRGLIRIQDELSAFILGLNQYKGGRGNDRSIALKLWAGESIQKDRVGHEANIPIRCRHPFLSIIGGLTPDMLGAMVDPKGRVDGFVERFVFCYPDPRPIPDWSDKGVPEDVIEDWCDLVIRLWTRQLNIKEGRSVPHVLFFSKEGRDEWKRLYNAFAAEMNSPTFLPSLRGTWGKLREYAGRLALILALMEQAADPTADDGALPTVGIETVRAAWRLISYFKSHARRVHTAIAQGTGGGGGPVVRVIVDWLRADTRLAFSESEFKQARRTIEPADLADALDFLSKQNAIRLQSHPEEQKDRRKGGRPRSNVYEVNPALFARKIPQEP